MAVNMNKRALWKVILTAYLMYLSVFGVESTTTTAPSTTENGTTAPTTTTTTTVATTTTAAPQSEAEETVFDPNSLIGRCPCNLNGNACDVNCCCDDECTEDDRQAFSSCLLYSYDVDDRLCFREEIIQFENSQPVYSNITDDNLFCIYYDNNEKRNYYTIPSKVESLQVFQDYRSQFLSFTFQSDFVSQFDFTASFYKSGKPIYTVFESLAIGVLGLPRSLTTPDCVDENPAAYLLDESFTCVRRLQNLAVECETTAGLDASNFFTGFRVVTSPQMFQDFNATLDGAVIDGFYSLYNNSYTIAVELDTGTVPPIQCISSTGLKGPCATDFQTPPSPTFSPGVCQNVLREVHYRLVTDGTTGITRVLASFVIGDVNSTDDFLQTFSSTFEKEGTDNIHQYSGNPGYVVGQPVLAGTRNETTGNDGNTVYQILLSGNRDAYMTVVRPSATGDCISDAAYRASVTFGNNMRTGCFLQISSSNLTEYCVLMQQAIVNTTEFDSVPVLNDAGTGYIANNRFVALYGNSDVNKTGDWVRILYENRPIPVPPSPGSSSCSLSLGMHIQILYANIGALINPQPKIIAVSFAYAPTTAVQIRCAGGTCQPNNPGGSQGVEISTAVAFIDVSTPAAKEQGEPPIFLAKVPYDFFYPFVSGGSASLTTVMSQVLPLVVLVLGFSRIWL